MSHIYRNEVLVYLCLNNATAKPLLGSSFFVIENRSRKKKKVILGWILLKKTLPSLV